MKGNRKCAPPTDIAYRLIIEAVGVELLRLNTLRCRKSNVKWIYRACQRANKPLRWESSILLRGSFNNNFFFKCLSFFTPYLISFAFFHTLVNYSQLSFHISSFIIHFIPRASILVQGLGGGQTTNKYISMLYIYML